MTLLTKVVLYADGERRSLPGWHKLSAEYRSFYVAKHLSDEERRTLETYYLHKPAQERLKRMSNSKLFFKRAKHARRALDLIEYYRSSGLCIPFQVWWKDKGNPKHPFTLLQHRMFKGAMRGEIMDITGGLLFWVSEKGRRKNEVLHEVIENIVIAYLNDTIPMHARIMRGELTEVTAQDVADEIVRRAEEAVGAILVARATYDMPDESLSARRPHPGFNGTAEAEAASAEGSAKAWLGQSPQV